MSSRLIRFADSLRDIRKTLVVRGMSRAGGQIPALAALDLQIRYAMDMAGLAASDTPTTAYGELLFAPRPAQSSGMGAAIAEWPYHSTAV